MDRSVGYYRKNDILELIMDKSDLQKRLKGLIKEEVKQAINERTYKHGGLLDPKNFDPIDPEVHIVGFGTMSRSALRMGIARRMEGAFKTAKDAAKGTAMTHTKYKNLEGLLGDKSVLLLMVKAEIEVAEQLDALRKKGGRRSIPIPNQNL